MLLQAYHTCEVEHAHENGAEKKTTDEKSSVLRIMNQLEIRWAMQFQRMFLKKKNRDATRENRKREDKKKKFKTNTTHRERYWEREQKKNEKKEVPTMWYTYGIVLGSVIALVVRKPRVLC